MLLYLSLAVPSTFVVHKYLGWTGVVVYLLLSAVVVSRFPRLSAHWSERRVAVLTMVTVAMVGVAFALIHPIADVHEPFAGSDDDDAYEVGVRALLAGRSPYADTTYLGNPLHQLPGAFVLAAPFVLLGTSALQNLFWLAMFFLAVRTEAGNGRTALRLSWIVLATSPAVMHGVVTGTAHVANTVYVLLGLWWLTRTSRPVPVAAAWGVALASRVNFLLLLPLAFGCLARTRNWRVAATASATAGLVAGAITLPFFLRDRATFGPLEAADRLFRFDEVVPHAGTIILATMLVSSGVLAAVRMDRATLFRYAAYVQAVPVAAGLVVSTAAFGAPDLTYAAYGTFAAWFGFIASVAQVAVAAPSPPAR